MTIELKRRIITAFVLSLIIYFCIFINLKISLIALIIISLLSWFEFTKLTNKIYRGKNKMISNAILFLSALYFIIFAGTAYYIIAIDKIYFFYILLICVFSDIGGYIFGKVLKGKKLTKISPNKTISGSYGSFLFALVPYFIFKLIFQYTRLEFLSFLDSILLNVLMCLYLSLICQLGDLFISYFKRKAKVKDTGRILPGHGGLLDRIDGIIFAIPSLALLGYLLEILAY